MKSFAAVFFALALSLLLTACGTELPQTRDAVFDLVTENQALLLDACSAQDPAPILALDGVTDLYEADGYWDVSCGWKGFGSQADSTGFYYVGSDDPTAVFPADLTPSDSGWQWEDPDSDNTCYLEKICNHFYYYELHL